MHESRSCNDAVAIVFSEEGNGAPGKSRTCDLLVRSPLIVLRAAYFQEDGIPLRGRSDGSWAELGDFRAMNCADFFRRVE